VPAGGGAHVDGLCTELSARGMRVRLAETRATVRDILRAEGLEARVGPVSRRMSVADAVAAAVEEGSG